MNNPWDYINLPSRDISARRIDHKHPLDLFWAKDHLGRFLFIYEFPIITTLNNKKKISPPNLVGIQTTYIPAANGEEKNRLVLLLNVQGSWEIFLSLCNDIVQATQLIQNSPDGLEMILGRLLRWQEFLKKSRIEILSEEEIMGLVGELGFIQNHLIPAFGADAALKFWHGPEGMPQDFNVNGNIVEIKCKWGGLHLGVKISSIDQLCVHDQELYLLVVFLEKTTLATENAINLPSLINKIRDALLQEGSAQIERFNDLLYMIGYIDSDRYFDFNFIPVREKMYLVSEGFPKICRKDLNPEIINVSYSINLANCSKFEHSPDWMGTIL